MIVVLLLALFFFVLTVFSSWVFDFLVGVKLDIRGVLFMNLQLVPVFVLFFISAGLLVLCIDLLNWILIAVILVLSVCLFTLFVIIRFT